MPNGSKLVLGTPDALFAPVRNKEIIVTFFAFPGAELERIEEGASCLIYFILDQV